MIYPYLKRYSFLMIVLLLLISLSSVTMASTGLYLLLGGGGGYLSNAKLDSTTITSTSVDQFTTVYTISYAHTNALDYLGRAAPRPFPAIACEPA